MSREPSRVSAKPRPGARLCAGVTNLRSGLIAAFRRQESGNVAILFGMMMMVMMLLMGSAIDLGRWLNARDQTYAAVDSALIAAGRAIQTGSTESAAIAIAKKVYQSNNKHRIKVIDDTINFTVEGNGATIRTLGSVNIKTPFLHFANIDHLPLFKANEMPEVTTAQERFNRYNSEVSLMLDVSGSMCPQGNCSKLTAMKAAAKDLVNILTRINETSQYQAKIGLIPFSAEVRPPPALLAVLTQPGLANSIKDDSKGYLSKTGCIAERMGDDRYTDKLPLPSDYLPVVYGSCSMGVNHQIVPLSADATMLNSKIDALTVAGGTAGHLGTAWARYLLSPKWAPVLGSSAPVGYNTAEYKKIAILMTDGEYNQWYRHLKQTTTTEETYICGYKGNGKPKFCTRSTSTTDVYKGTAYDTNSVSGSINIANSITQALAHCAAMKADGIEVYTVGFELGNNATAINTLRECATDQAHAYLAESSESLMQVFRDIAVKLTNLYVSK